MTDPAEAKTSALKELVDLYEIRIRQEHADRMIGKFDSCPYCANDVDLISRARAELERGVDVVRLLEDAELSTMDETVEDMTKALRAQNVRVVEDGKEST